jgi:5-histidylcysteine sulfoxide synthase/putative 4-mercaptohistidine N1-methyltranferase
MVATAVTSPRAWVTRTTWLDGDDAYAKCREIRDYFRKTWELTESLFALIENPPAFYVKHEPLRHPLIFYYGHPAVFYINKLVAGRFTPDRINTNLEAMLAVGVDEMSWDDLDSTHYDWPTIEELRDYRAKAFQRIDNFISGMPIELPISQQSAAWAVLMGIEHERIHIETSSVTMREMPLIDCAKQPTSGPWVPCPTAGPSPARQWIDMTGGSVELGKPDSDRTYGWDNEFGTERHDVPPFKASQCLVSNGDFLAFVEDSGYLNRCWWCEEGWSWCSEKSIRFPHFWRATEDGFRLRLLLEERELPLNWPVEVNALEAAAYCRWLSHKLGLAIQLPTELQARYLRQQLPDDQPHWRQAPGNINLEGFGSPCPIDLYRQGDLYDIIGNVWQWTRTPIRPLQGFRVHPLYDDFSIPTFDDKHNLMCGGSWISTGNFALSSVRYGVRRHFFQHAGFRVVADGDACSGLKAEACNPVYESEPSVCQYLDFHYGPSRFGVPNYPKACVDALLPFLGGLPLQRALDVGCSVGRSSFELAQHFEHVDAIDFSVRFIQSALELARGNSLGYSLLVEGDIEQPAVANLDDVSLLPFASRVSFWQADACNLRSTFANYDLVFAANLLDRLYAPMQFLRQLNATVKPNGLLVLSSPYTWLEEFTPREQWLGGRYIDGKPLTSVEALQAALEGWTLLARMDLQFVIRETARKYQHSISDYTIWRRMT